MLKRFYFPIVIILALFIGVLMYSLYGTYDSFSQEEIIRSENAGKTNYKKAFGGILSYNTDGVLLMDYSGNQKWNLSFEMQNPMLLCKQDYSLVYDRQGTVLEILNKTGESARINTSYPISNASLSNTGRVSVIMQRKDVANVVTYDSSGNIVAEGELHGGEGGFPLALSLSDDGVCLVVSALHLSEASVKTDIVFYDFSEEGNKHEDNKLAVFSLMDEVVPVVDHVADGKVLIAGTGSVKVYSAGKDPKVLTEEFYRDIKSFVHNDRYFAVVKEEKKETGEVVNILDMYTMSGKERFSKEIDANYSKCEIMENDEIFMTDGNTGIIYTKHGVEKFNCPFDGELSSMIPAGGLREYYLLQGGELSKISLR